MSGYEALKFLHIAAVIAWIGGGIGIFTLQTRLMMANERGPLMAIGGQMESFSKVYFSPLAAATLLTGMFMVGTTDGLSFTDAWILIGFGGIVVSMGIGLGAIRPTGQKLVQESQKTPPDGAAMAGYAKRMRVLTVTNLVLLMVVVWAMVVKPGL